MSVDERDRGWIIDAVIGTYWRCWDENTYNLKHQKYKMQWRNVDRDEYGFNCGSEKCEVFIKKEVLRLRRAPLNPRRQPVVEGGSVGFEGGHETDQEPGRYHGAQEEQLDRAGGADRDEEPYLRLDQRLCR